MFTQLCAFVKTCRTVYHKRWILLYGNYTLIKNNEKKILIWKLELGSSLSYATNLVCNRGLSSNPLWVSVPKCVKWDWGISQSLLLGSIKTSLFKLVVDQMARFNSDGLLQLLKYHCGGTGLKYSVCTHGSEVLLDWKVVFLICVVPKDGALGKVHLVMQSQLKFDTCIWTMWKKSFGKLWCLMSYNGPW